MAQALTGTSWQFELHTVSRRPPPPGHHVSLVLQSAQGSCAEVMIEPALAKNLAQRVLGVDTPTFERPALVSDVEIGILLFLTSRLLPPEGDWTVHQCSEASGSEPSGNQGSRIHGLGSLKVGQVAGWCRIALADDAHRAALEDMTVEVTVDAGLGLFEAAELKQLAVADTVFVNPCWITSVDPLRGETRVCPRGGTGAIHARIEDNHLECVQVLQGRGDNTPAQDVQSSMRDSVVVTLELASMLWKLGDLTRFSPGDRHALPERAARLRVGQEVIADGALVQHENAIGIQIRAITRPTPC